MYEEMIKVAMQTGSDIVGCPSIVDFDDGSHRENLSDIHEGYIDKNQCIVDFLEGNKHAWGAVHNKIYKRILWKDIRFPAVNHLEDYAVSSKLFNEANLIWFCAHPYYHYTFSNTSLSKSGRNPKRITILETTDAITDYLRNNCSEPSVIKATYRFRFMMDLDLLWSVHKRKPEDVRQIKKRLRKRSLAGLSGYIAHARKEKSDIKQIIKFIISLVC